MTTLARLVTNDDTLIQVQVMADDVAVDISAASQVRAALIDKFHSELLIAPVTVLSTDAGNDWDNGIVGILFDGDSSADLEAAICDIEIEVVLGGRPLTFFQPVDVVVGLVV